VDSARSGSYPLSIAADVSAEQLNRYFVRSADGYRVSKAIRECCIFSRQNVTRDPPFSRLDLVSCRNVMIYLGTMLQRRTLSIFHYALKKNRYLLLGNSETIGDAAELFDIVDRKNKIYRKRGMARMARMEFQPAQRLRLDRSVMEERPPNVDNVVREAERTLLARFSPAGVIIDDDMNILQFRGRTAPYLEPAPGVPTLNVLKMAREGLLAELRAAILTARKSEGPVRREAIRLKTNGHAIDTNIEVIPFRGTAQERLYIVLFEQGPEVVVRGKGKKKETKEPAPDEHTRLRRELEATREYLQSIIEEQEAMNEELRSANEEIQSSNEELQSTNEELETAKEELQSSNEELTTLNEELENRNRELAEVNNDLINLLASVDIPILMLDAQLRVRRFNVGAQRLLNIIPADVGRSIRDLKLALNFNDVGSVLLDVIDTLEVREMEVEDRTGRRYLMRVRPYRTMENKIEGVTVVMIDLEQVKRAT
jgi:two-component system, chemotaxis family, CheB/CheR fusion protein